MALKTDMIPSSAKGFRLVGKLYRWVGWVGVVLTVLATVYGVLAYGHQMATSDYPYYGGFLNQLLMIFLLGLLIFLSGLSMCAVAFLVSAIIDTCVNITENNRARTDVLRRIVREQSDVQ